MGGGGGGAVNSVTASAPIASSGGANPNISLTGVVAAANGGTGLAAPGAVGNVLTSNGVGWATAPLPASVTSVSGAAPLSSSGGTTPTISLTGIVAAANGGTGIAAPGVLGNVLTSNGAGAWTSSAPASTSPAAPLTSVQFNNGGAFGGSAGLTWNGSTLAVDGAVDRATAGTLTVGGATATAITIGDVGVTTTFPGPVNLSGDVTTVGGTQFTTDATFDGNVTFGNAATDNISFVGQVDTAITQEGIAAPAVSPAGTGRIYFDSGSNTFKASQNGGAYVDVITGGTVTSVGASSPLASSGGTTPTISFTGWPANASGALTNDGAGNLSWAPSGGGTITGSGTATQIAYFTGATAIGSETAVGSDSFTWDSTNNRLGVVTATPNEALTVNGVLSLAEGTAPTNTAAFGKLWANSAADARPYWLDDTGQAFNLTLDRFNTLTPAASVAIDTSPALPVFNSLAINQNTTFTTTNLGNGRSASVRVIGDASTRTLTWPAGWTWLGSGVPPTSLAANDVGYLSITAYGAADTDVVAAWSYENAPAVVTGSGVATRVAFWNGTSSLSSDANLYWDDTNNRLGIGTATPVAALDLASGQLAIPDGTAAAPAVAFRDDLNTGLFSPANDVVGVAVNGTEVARFNQSGAGSTPVLLMGTTSVIGAITVDSSDPSGTAGVGMIAHAAAGTAIQESFKGGQFAGLRTRGTKGAPTQIGADDGLLNMIGAGYTATGGYNYGALVTFKAEQAYTAAASGGRIEFHTTTNGTDGITTLGGSTTERMRIANNGHVGIGTTNIGTHLFNIGSGASANFSIESGGRIHTYGGATPTDGQVLIGDTAQGRFESATLTAGAGISITNGAGAVTIAATGAAASTSVDIPSTAQEALNAGDLVRFVNDAGTPKVQKADATNTDARLNPVGFAVAAASAGAAVTVRVSGVADVPAGRFDAAPAAADVGKRVFVSTTSGQITLTAPSASGDVLQRAGVLVDGGANPKVLVQVGDPVLL